MIRSVIVSNELQSGKALAETLQAHCNDISIVGMAYDVDDGRYIVQQCQPELTFWDVPLHGGQGFQIADDFPFPVFHGVFVTAYNYCAQAESRCMAFDYLLKPLSLGSLLHAVERFRLMQTPAKGHIKKTRETTAPRRIAVSTMHDIQFVDVERIVWLEAERNYTVFHLADSTTITVARTLKEYEHLLVGMPFLRVHQSHIINLNNVVRYIRGKGGFAVMCDGSVICVSPRRKAEFLNGIQYVAVF